MNAKHIMAILLAVLITIISCPVTAFSETLVDDSIEYIDERYVTEETENIEEENIADGLDSNMYEDETAVQADVGIEDETAEQADVGIEDEAAEQADGGVDDEAMEQYDDDIAEDGNEIEQATPTAFDFMNTAAIYETVQNVNYEILHETENKGSSAAPYFKTEDAEFTERDGKLYLKMEYSNAMIGPLSQNLGGEGYIVLDVIESGDENGTKYVEVEFNNANEIALIGLVINTPIGVMNHIVRIVITSGDVTKLSNGEYSVPVKLLNADGSGKVSMANGVLDGNATVTVINGYSYIDTTIKKLQASMGPVQIEGYLMSLLSHEGTTSSDNATAAEATVISRFSGEGEEEYPNKFRIGRSAVGESQFFVSLSTTAGTFTAILELDYSDVTSAAAPEANNFIANPVIAPYQLTAGNGKNVTVGITAPTNGAAIYYTTDGSTPNESSDQYTGLFTVTGSNQTVSIKAIAVKEGAVSSNITQKQIVFAGAAGGSEAADVKQDGKYWVDIYIWNAASNQASMGDYAMTNNRRGLITTSGGVSTLQMATNPVNIGGHTSALGGFLYYNGSEYVDVDDFETISFTTNTAYAGVPYTFDYFSKLTFDIPDTSNEYLNIKISVPYTPMQDVMDDNGGYLDARLKFDWSTLTAAGANASLTSNSSVSSASDTNVISTSFSGVDTVTGIKITAEENIVPNGASIEVSTITSGNEYDNVKAALGDEITSFTAYSILLKNNLLNFAPESNIKIYIPVIEEFDAENTVIYKINDDGTKVLIEMVIEDGYYVVETKALGVFAICDATVPVEIEELALEEDTAKEDEPAFADTEGHWAEEAINYVAERGLFFGVGNSEFAPNATMTKAMLVTVLSRIEGVEPRVSKVSGFADVSEDDYFFNAVEWAYENGIVSGASGQQFIPAAPVTREEMAAIIAGYVRYKTIELDAARQITFSDSDTIHEWAADDVTTLAEAGILSGRPDGCFDPHSAATRAEVAFMLMNFIEGHM